MMHMHVFSCFNVLQIFDMSTYAFTNEKMLPTVVIKTRAS